MVSDDFSCIKEVTKVVHLTLPSSFNSNEVSGICDALESWKRQYIQQLQGIVVSYKNVSLTSKCGFLKIDYPVIHCNVKATFELFYPSVGSIVKGKVNRISHDHIGCLVHDTVNVTVHRTSDISEEDSKCIALDRYILFQITRISFKRKIIHVKGKITEECINLMKTSGLFDQEAEISENNRVTCTSPQFSFLERENNIHQNMVCNDVQNSVDETSSTVSSQFSSPSKKKKRKRDKEDELSSPSIFSQSLDSGINEIDPTQVPITPPKKKHKSKTNLVPEEIRSFSSTDADSVLHIKDEVNTTESDISTSPTKSHKKKKRRISSDIPGLVSPSNNMNPDALSMELTNSLSESDISLSSKKKKKKHKKSKDSPSTYNEPEKKHKKSKEDMFDSPSTFNEPAKKHKKSKDGTFNSPSGINKPEKRQEKSESGSTSEEDNSESLLKPNIIYPGSHNIHASPVKIKQESPANEDLLSTLLASLKDVDNAQDHKDVKKAKKRKHDSTDDVGLPKKKRKGNDEKTTEKHKKKKKEKLEKDSKKEKKKKKGKKKEKSEKDSKKSKKAKTKVLSTKKKPFGSKIKSKKKSKNKKDKLKTEKNDQPTE